MPSPIARSFAATSLHRLYSTSMPVSSSLMRSASSLFGRRKNDFICTSLAAISMNSLALSISSARTPCTMDTYWSMSFTISISARLILFLLTRYKSRSSGPSKSASLKVNCSICSCTGCCSIF